MANGWLLFLALKWLGKAMSQRSTYEALDYIPGWRLDINQELHIDWGSLTPFMSYTVPELADMYSMGPWIAIYITRPDVSFVCGGSS